MHGALQVLAHAAHTCCDGSHVAPLQHCLVDDPRVVVQATSQAQVKADGTKRVEGLSGHTRDTKTVPRVDGRY
jgi:hypothetical protein